MLLGQSTFGAPRGSLVGVRLFVVRGKDFGRAGGRMCQVDVAINWFQCFNVAYRAHAVLCKWDYPGAEIPVNGAHLDWSDWPILFGFPGDDSTLRRGTFHEACGVGWAVAQGLPSDGHDAEGALRFSQTSFRRQVGRPFKHRLYYF